MVDRYISKFYEPSELDLVVDYRVSDNRYDNYNILSLKEDNYKFIYINGHYISEVNNLWNPPIGKYIKYPEEWLYIGIHIDSNTHILYNTYKGKNHREIINILPYEPLPLYTNVKNNNFYLIEIFPWLKKRIVEKYFLSNFEKIVEIAKT